MAAPGMDLITTLCPHCYSAVKDRHPACEQCGAPSAVDRRVRMTLGEYLDLPKQPCPRCQALKPARAPACMACKHRATPGEAPPALPPELVPWLTAVTFEDSDVVAVVPEAIAAEALGARLGLAGLAGSLGAARSRDRRAASWRLEGAVRVPGVRDPVAITAEGERVGWPVEFWLEPFGPEHASRCFEPVRHPERAFALGARFAAGASFAGQVAGAPSAGFEAVARAAWLAYWAQFVVARAVAPEAYYFIDQTGGVARAKHFEPRAPDEAYSLFVTSDRGRAWVHTEGLPRWGAPDLELFDVPEAQVESAIAFLHAVVRALAARRLPPPGEPIALPDGRHITYAPFDGRLGPTPGRREADRRRFRHGAITPRPAG